MSGPINFNARLTALGPNYYEWKKIFETDTVPLTSPIAMNASLHGQPIKVYEIDYRLLTISELEKLCEIIMLTLKTNDFHKAIEYLSMRGGYPIPEEDIVITALKDPDDEET